MKGIGTKLCDHTKKIESIEKRRYKNNIIEAIKEKRIVKGQEFKNYRELCKAFNEKTNEGNAKIRQVETWEQYVKLKKIKPGYRIKIEEIYEKPHTKFPQFSLYGLKEMELGGIYKIQYKNIAYIGSTKNFYDRFRQHYNKSQLKNQINGKEISTTDLLRKGGIMEPIEIIGDFYHFSTPEEEIQATQNMLSKEKEYIKEYSEKKDIILLNVDYNKKTTRLPRTRRQKMNSITEQNNNKEKKKCGRKSHILVNRDCNNKNYKFLLDDAFEEIIQGISEKIENSSLYEIINKAPEDKTTISLPYSIKIGNDKNIREYEGVIEVKKIDKKIVGKNK